MIKSQLGSLEVTGKHFEIIADLTFILYHMIQYSPEITVAVLATLADDLPAPELLDTERFNDCMEIAQSFRKEVIDNEE